jgi:hypothetical protein
MSAEAQHHCERCGYAMYASVCFCNAPAPEPEAIPLRVQLDRATSFYQVCLEHLRAHPNDREMAFLVAEAKGLMHQAHEAYVKAGRAV